MHAQQRPLPVTQFPLLQEMLAERDVQFVPDTANLTYASLADLKHLQERNIVSAVRIPLLQDGALLGVLGLDTMGRPMDISGRQKDMLRLLGQMLSDLLQKTPSQPFLELAGFPERGSGQTGGPP